MLVVLTLAYFVGYCSATLLKAYVNTDCTTGEAAFTVDVTSGRCYNLPSTGTCTDTKLPGCAKVPTATDRDLAALMATANCTSSHTSFTISEGQYDLYSGPNCSGLHSKLILYNP